MQNIIAFFVFSLLSISITYANGTIVLQSGETSQTFVNLDAAYEAAKDGDIILVGAGHWTTFKDPIRKSISIIGNGYDPRYTVATGTTNIIGKFDIRVSNVTIEGIHLTGHIEIWMDDNKEVSNLVISRCRFDSFFTKNANLLLNNLLIKESVFEDFGTSLMYDPMVFQSVVSNCFILGSVYYQSGMKYKNNIFFGATNFRQMGDLEFINNIFTHWKGNIATWQRRITFSHNIFADDADINYAEVNINNKHNVGNSTIFESFPDTDTYTFDYVHTYKLKNNGPAKGAGNDGKDCGVWGGDYPWKEISVPMLPYIKEATVSPATNAQGKLNVKFRVEAQNK